jgi:hypothetical protein
MTAKPKKAPPPPRDPGRREAAAIKDAISRLEHYPARLTVGGEAGKIEPPHSDHAGWTNHLAITFGTTSDAFMSAAVGSLEWASRRRGRESLEDVASLNAALALVGAINPADELEAAIAVQMASTHSLATELLGRAKQSSGVETTQVYANLAVKLQNTFTAQVTALAKLRGGGKQQVEVRHVYVNGNAVIGDVHATGGEAGAAFGNQPHAQGLPHLPGAPCPPMRSADAEGEALPVAGGEGAEAVSDAWGQEPRRTGRKG